MGAIYSKNIYEAKYQHYKQISYIKQLEVFHKGPSSLLLILKTQTYPIRARHSRNGLNRLSHKVSAIAAHNKGTLVPLCLWDGI